MRIFLAGCDGYLGSLLGPMLVRHGHEVVGCDTGFYREGLLYGGEPTLEQVITKDIRRIVVADLAGFDGVVHMGELSNDPTCQLAPEITHEINHRGSVQLARTAREAGVERFVYSSSCSVYGLADRDLVDETCPVNPQTAYAECKALVERDLQTMADNRFCPVIFRNGTAYGASTRMRFDIVLNNLAGLAWTSKQIRMSSDGSPWRPLVHALDIGRAVLEVLAAPREAVAGEIFNVGATEQNYRVREVAEIVAKVFPECEVSCGPAGADNRSYRVSFEKIRRHLPGYRCEWDAQRGAEQLHKLFKKINLTAEMFSHRAFTRLKMLEHLSRTGSVDEHFFWRER